MKKRTASRQSVNISSFSAVWDAVGKFVFPVSEVNERLSESKDVNRLKKHIRRFKEQEKNIGHIIKKLKAEVKEKDPRLNNNIIRGMTREMVEKLEKICADLKKAVVWFDEGMSGHPKTVEYAKANPQFQEFFNEAKKRHHKNDAAINRALLHMSEALGGGATALHQIFQLDPIFIPRGLGKAPSKDQIKQRLIRARKELKK